MKEGVNHVCERPLILDKNWVQRRNTIIEKFDFREKGM